MGGFLKVVFWVVVLAAAVAGGVALLQYVMIGVAPSWFSWGQ